MKIDIYPMKYVGRFHPTDITLPRTLSQSSCTPAPYPVPPIPPSPY